MAVSTHFAIVVVKRYLAPLCTAVAENYSSGKVETSFKLQTPQCCGWGAMLRPNWWVPTAYNQLLGSELSMALHSDWMFFFLRAIERVFYSGTAKIAGGEDTLHSRWSTHCRYKPIDCRSTSVLFLSFLVWNTTMKNHSVFLNKIEKERAVLSFRGTVICCCVELAKLSCDWFKMLSLVRDPLVRTNMTYSQQTKLRVSCI